MSSPAVTAVMLTGKCPQRDGMAEVALKCFLDQTYRGPRGVIVVNEAARDRQFLSPQRCARLGITYNANPEVWPRGVFHIEEASIGRPEYSTLGHLRNVALHHVRRTWPGSLIVVWDDDDWMAPNYIETMVRHYAPGRISLMRYQLKHDLDFDTSFVARSSTGWHGQAVFGSDVPHDYPHVDRGEDTAFKNLFGDRVIVFDNDPSVYVRTAHGNNTWSRQHIMGRLCGQRGRHDVSPEQLALIRKVRKLYGRDKHEGGGHAEEAAPEATGG